MGYKLRRQTADALRIELWKRGVEILELNRNQHDRDTIEKVARSLKIKLDWSNGEMSPLRNMNILLKRLISSR